MCDHTLNQFCSASRYTRQLNFSWIGICLMLYSYVVTITLFLGSVYCQLCWLWYINCFSAPHNACNCVLEVCTYIHMCVIIVHVHSYIHVHTMQYHCRTCTVYILKIVIVILLSKPSKQSKLSSYCYSISFRIF